MNGVRVAITAFVLVLIGLASLGWVWTGSHQAPALARASHVVLALAVAAGLVAIVVIWRHNPDERPDKASSRS